MKKSRLIEQKRKTLKMMFKEAKACYWTESGDSVKTWLHFESRQWEGVTRVTPFSYSFHCPVEVK